ncbi:DnaT-like ssDNA-binding protein [Pseudomonas sp. BEA3.1]|uniref:DnaT-like ssDNA-binding protein n=1 Tax=Pseudomonas sp. BEA3.1 TaxID=3083251 RepID=UPI002963E833|nr:DnaT-like ssDNA-binding protein [Pseudomonas sp. BEA3.1]MDW2775252.1 DnaT-like ssDNA-binding protein [Pseudomonas sp. BEA3.1]
MPEFYGSVAGADAYHTARANAAWTGSDDAKQAALIRASAYIDGKYQQQNSCGRWESMFSGSKTGGRGQELQWPRTGASDNEGATIPSSEVPAEIEKATYEAALRELVTPGSLSPDYVAAEAIKRQKVDVLEIEYQASTDGGVPTRPVLTVVDELVAPLLRSNRLCGVAVFVV